MSALLSCGLLVLLCLASADEVPDFFPQLTVVGEPSCPWFAQYSAQATEAQAQGMIGIVTLRAFPNRDAFDVWLVSEDGRERFVELDPAAADHTTVPFVYVVYPDETRYSSTFSLPPNSGHLPSSNV